MLNTVCLREINTYVVNYVCWKVEVSIIVIGRTDSTGKKVQEVVKSWVHSLWEDCLNVRNMGTCFQIEGSKTLEYVCEADLVSTPFFMSRVNTVETEVSYPNQICMFTSFFLFILKVRAQLVQQQQAAAAVQAAQAQAAQMGASGQVRAQEPVSLVIGL